MELLSQYGLFLAKIATVVIAIAVVAVLIVNLTQRSVSVGVTHHPLSEQYKEMQEEMSLRCLIVINRNSAESAEEKHKQEAKAAKAKAKLNAPQDKATPLVYVLDFKGSMDAHEVSSLREEVTAVLAVATPCRIRLSCVLKARAGWFTVRTGRLTAAAPA